MKEENIRKRAEGAPTVLRRAVAAGRRHLYVLALRLQQKTSGLSPRRLKACVLLFCGLSLLVCSAVVVQGVRGRPTRVLPRMEPAPGALPPVVGPRIPFRSKEDLRRLLRLSVTLDSLYTTAAGKRWRDSVLPLRPRLLDTLNFLQQYYNQQSQK